MISPRRRLLSIRLSFEANGGLVRRRGFGFVAALRINSTRRSNASRRFWAWVRCRLASIIKMPSWVIRCPARRVRRFRTSSGSEEPARSNRNCTAVDTLLTFWPPGPEERINSKRIFFSSTARSPVIGIMLINYPAPANNSSSRIPVAFNSRSGRVPYPLGPFDNPYGL